VKKKYGALGHSVLTVQLERGRQGLGLSLAGHKDRNRMAVFVCGLNPNGAAFRSGSIQVGDEILEVSLKIIFTYIVSISNVLHNCKLTLILSSTLGIQI
jgi:PDZ domain (Also known as DHR or GLGF).